MLSQAKRYAFEADQLRDYSKGVKDYSPNKLNIALETE